MKRILLITFLLPVFLFFTSCKTQPKEESRRNIILDVDTSVDDIMTILYFLGCPDINIRAITIANGVSGVDSGAEIVLRLLSLTGHPEIPVAKGISHPLEGDNAFPLVWQPPVDKPFGLELPDVSLKPSDTPAPEMIAQLINTYKNDITILALGPMTNIAQVMVSRPELVKNISQIYVSDGAVNMKGGIAVEWPAIDNQVSGWNFWVDARAAAIVFSSGAPVRLVPLDVTALHGIDPLVLTADLYENYKHQSMGIIGKSMASLMGSWLDSYVTSEKTDTVTKEAPIWDVVAGMVFHHPEIATDWQDCHAKIQEGSDEIAGQIVTLDSGTPNVRICLKGNQVLLDSLLLLTAAN
ncbi:MAG: nucleoside hydrolase [Bacteroidales bacterium]|nr:nucleoside hydrolase [Bacteroidales bacterium]